MNKDTNVVQVHLSSKWLWLDSCLCFKRYEWWGTWIFVRILPLGRVHWNHSLLVFYRVCQSWPEWEHVTKLYIPITSGWSWHFLLTACTQTCFALLSGYCILCGIDPFLLKYLWLEHAICQWSLLAFETHLPCRAPSSQLCYSPPIMSTNTCSDENQKFYAEQYSYFEVFELNVLQKKGLYSKKGRCMFSCSVDLVPTFVLLIWPTAGVWDVPLKALVCQ